MRHVLPMRRHPMLWCGEFEFARDDLKVEQGKWRKYKDVWSVTGRWVDTLPNRLGGSPLEAHVFYSSREDVEYFVVGLAHGRALGEKSVEPNPARESALAAEMKSLIDIFGSDIVPLSSDRR